MRNLPVMAFLFATLLASEGARAQLIPVESPPHWYIGARAGINSVTENIDPNPLFETISGQMNFTGGAEIDYAFSKWFALSIQPRYEQKGYHNVFALPPSLLSSIPGDSIGGQPLNFSITSDLTATYIEVPIVVRLTFPSGNWEPYFFAGPSIGILLSATGKANLSLSAGGFPISLDSSEDAKRQLSPMDISGYVGSGIAYHIPFAATIFVEAGYAFGLSNVWNNGYQGILTNPLNVINALSGLGGGGIGGGSNALSIFGAQNQTVTSRDFRIAAGFLIPLD